MIRNKRKLYSSEELIDEFTKGLELVETNGWTTKYYDDSNKQYWLKYVTEIHRGLTTFSAHLITLTPPPTTDELIDITLKSPYPDEVIAAANRLYLDEQEKHIEFRGELLAKLYSLDISKLLPLDKDRIRNIIQHTSLLHAINIRPIVGKHHTEIEKDAEFFASTSKKANDLLGSL